MTALILALIASAPPEPAWPNADPAERFTPASPPTKADLDRIEANKHFTVAMFRMRQDRWAEGLQELREALVKLPTHLPALQQAARAAAQLDRRDESLDYCRRAVALDPKDVERLYIGGLLLAASGNDGEALSFLERARDVEGVQYRDPGRYVSIREALVELYDKRKSYDLLSRTLTEILELVEHPDRYELNPLEQRVLGRQRLAFYLKRAEAMRAAKKFGAAEVALKELAAREPALQKRILVDVAQIQLEDGRPTDAIKSLEEHFAFGESNVKSAIDTLEKAHAKIGSAEFIPRLDRLVRSQPNNTMLARTLAIKLFDAGEFKRAEEMLQQLASDRETIPLLIRTYVKMRNAPMLLRTLRRLLQSRPGDDDVEPVLGELERDHELLKSVAKEAMAPDGPEKLSVVDRERLLDLVGQRAYQAGLYETAAALFRKCVDISPQAREHHWRLTLSLLRAEKFEETIKAADQSLAVNADDVDVLELKASAMARLGKTADAVKMLNELAARTKTPDQTIEVKLAIAGAYQQGKDLAKAAEIYRNILDEMGQSTDAHRIRYLLSGVYSQLNENKKAEAELVKIVEANPRPTERILAGANNDLGFLWVDEGRNLDRAEQMIRSALKSEPDNPAYQDSLGWALFKRGRDQESKEMLQKAATAKSGDDPVVWDHLGDVLHRLGDRTGAAKAWKTATQLYDKGIHGTPKEKGDLLRGKAGGLLGKDWEKMAP